MNTGVSRYRFCAAVVACGLVLPAAAQAQTPSGGASPQSASPGTQAQRGTGGVQYGSRYTIPSKPIVAGDRAVLKKGIAYAPANAPLEVQKAIWAGNRIQRHPYRLGGGHNARRLMDTAFDCSGTISFVLRAAGLLETPLDSSAFMKWGVPGVGRWITVYTNPGHAYVVLAGLRLDTSTGGERTPASTGKGPRWRRTARSAANGPFVVRHIDGL